MDGNIGNHLTRGTRSSIISSVERETTQLRQFPSDRFRTGGDRNLSQRNVAQFGRALALGASGRRFESYHSDCQFRDWHS